MSSQNQDTSLSDQLNRLLLEKEDGVINLIRQGIFHHKIELGLDYISLCDIKRYMSRSRDYRDDYNEARQELADLLAKQCELETRKLFLRRRLELLGALCRDEGIEVEPSREARYLLEHTNLAGEIRSVLRGYSPEWVRPIQMKRLLEMLGHDIKKYDNPQSTIQTTLKRMVDAGEIEVCEMPEDGKKAYRYSSAALAKARFGGLIAIAVHVGTPVKSGRTQERSVLAENSKGKK